MAGTHRGGTANSKMTKLVLATYGVDCWLKLPGCTYIATTRDHVIPVSQGGADTLENCRPACRNCNSTRQDRTIRGTGATVHVITGPPASGKTTYARNHAHHDDVIIDFDAIARALTPTPDTDQHDFPDHIRHVAIGARAAAINRATRLHERVTVWLIHAMPTPKDLAQYQSNGWQVTHLDPGRSIVEARASSRGTYAQDAINRHYTGTTTRTTRQWL